MLKKLKLINDYNIYEIRDFYSFLFYFIACNSTNLYYVFIILLLLLFVINNLYEYVYMMAIAQFPDMKIIPFSKTDTPMRHMVGTTVRGLMYFNIFPITPVKI